MSRIGKQTIKVPDAVEITIQGHHIKVKGPKGELEYTFPDVIEVLHENGNLIVKRKNDEKQSRAFHGLVRSLVSNMVIGVSAGFEKRLEIIGVGYRAQATGNKITLNLGYSHPINLNAKEGVSIEMDKEDKNIIIISGIDKQAVGETAALIRKYRKPEPYKGKGIRYSDEYVHRKAGKAAAKAAT